MPPLRRVFRELHPVLRVAFVLATLLAAGYTTRLAMYMYDETRTGYSALDRTFFRNHSCLSSYTEAARLAPTGANIFDPKVYAVEGAGGELKERSIGSFEVDLYQYPPPFLVLPVAAEKAGLDFFEVRRLWFVIQMIVLVAGLAITAVLLGGLTAKIAGAAVACRGFPLCGEGSLGGGAQHVQLTHRVVA